MNISLSVDLKSTQAFICTLLTELLSLNEHDIKPLLTDFKLWSRDQTDLLKAIGISKEYTAVCNRVLASSTFSEEEADNLVAILKVAKPKLTADTTIPAEHLSLINYIASNLRTNSDSSWLRIHKLAHLCGSAKLTAIFTLDEQKLDDSSYKNAVKTCQTIVKSQGGKGAFLTPQEAQELRANNPDKAVEYSAAAKILNTAAKTEIFNFVRSSGKAYLLIETVRKHLTSKGLASNLPVGFEGGQVSADYKFFTKEGRELDKVPSGIVVMNPKYKGSEDNTYVMNDIPNKIRYRTLEFLKGNRSVRHDLVQDFLKHESTYRTKWVADLAADDTKNQIMAYQQQI
jgi:hypothetical protein